MAFTPQFDQFDLEAMAEGNAIRNFKKNIGESTGRVGTPKSQTRLRSCKKADETHRKNGAKPGIWGHRHAQGV
jgi:hypothetical protein